MHAVQSHAQHEAAARQALEAHQAAWQAECAAAAAAAEQRLAAVVGARDALQARLEALAARLLRLAKREARREKQRGVLCVLLYTMYIICQMQGVGLSSGVICTGWCDLHWLLLCFAARHASRCTPFAPSALQKF